MMDNIRHLVAFILICTSVFLPMAVITGKEGVMTFYVDSLLDF